MGFTYRKKACIIRNGAYIMERVTVEQLNPGMILARSIFLADGRILCRKKTAISQMAITKFKELRLPAVYITSHPDDNTVYDSVSDTTRSDLMQILSKLSFDLRTSQNISLYPCKQILTNLIDEILENQNIIPAVNEIRIFNDYVYSHSFNVGIIAVKIGIRLGYDQSKLLDLALGAFLHDLGMTRIAPEILGRVGGLTKEEIGMVRTHPKIGHDLVHQITDISKNALQVIYQHHERLNGSGYPKGIRGDEITELARIVMVADVFDAMTSEKLYRKAKPVAEVIDYLKSLITIEFDPVVVAALIKIYETK
jgi:HD-GYP domain-containing protein (c-di-GMP phosphodiesterase class II)